MTDKILGTTIDAGETNRQYSEYKVEHTGDPLDQLLTVEEDGEQVTLEESEQTLNEYFNAPVRADTDTTEEYTVVQDDGTETTERYDHRVRVADAATRDAVLGELTDVKHDSFEYALTAKQRVLIERDGETNAREIERVLSKKNELFDRNLVEQDDIRQISSQFDKLATENPYTAKTFNTVAHILTGNDMFEINDINATLAVEDGKLTNDGTETETLTVTHDSSTKREAILQVAGSSFNVTLVPGEDYTQDMTTTKSSGSTIEVKLLGNFIEPDAVTIEVVA